MQAASRGLQEELGISVAATSLEGPLVPTHLRQLHVPEVGVIDCEFVTSFRSVLASSSEGRHFATVSKQDQCLQFGLTWPFLSKQACRLDNWRGEVVADSAEVHAWKYARLPDILANMNLHPDDYTPWFRAEAHAVFAADQ